MKPDAETLRIGWLTASIDSVGVVNIYGDRRGLRFLAEFVRARASSKRTLSLDDASELYPEDVPLRGVELVPTAEPVRVAIHGDVLEISGSVELRSVLAYNLDFLSESNPQQTITPHTHIEYWPDHDYLDETSEALCVYLERP